MLTNGTPSCTCTDHEPRPVHWAAEYQEWTHTDDTSWANTVHLHTYRMSRDCDGQMSHETYVLPRTDDPFADTPEMWAREAMLDSVPWSGYRTTIVLDADEMHAESPTDEGYWSLDARMCNSPECRAEWETRDYQAEAAGY